MNNIKYNGEELTYNEFPSRESKKNPSFRENYDLALRKHLIYHLSSTRFLESYIKIITWTRLQAIALLEDLIKNPITFENCLTNQYVQLNNRILSLDILFNLYCEQLNIEFSALNQTIDNSYVYTIDPPSIFAKAIGIREEGVEVLNRLQCLAFKRLLQEQAFYQKLHIVTFNNYADKNTLYLLQGIFHPKGVKVISKSELFSSSGEYLGPENCALVLHNNSDGFGQNIEFEHETSLDGIIGYYSDAASILHRQRPDLTKKIIEYL